jgi:disulfide bond formation protein DsbB
MNEIILKIISFCAIIIIFIVFVAIILDTLKIKHPFKDLIAKYRLEMLFLISLGATVGSLLLSIYFKLAPCELCWYQRAFLFCLPVISFIALIKKDTRAYVYVYYLALIGLVFAAYHSLLQSKIFSSSNVFCDPNAVISCAVPAFTYFGFVTVPIISFSVFLLISYISYVSDKK